MKKHCKSKAKTLAKPKIKKPPLKASHISTFDEMEGFDVKALDFVLWLIMKHWDAIKPLITAREITSSVFDPYEKKVDFQFDFDKAFVVLQHTSDYIQHLHLCIDTEKSLRSQEDEAHLSAETKIKLLEKKIAEWKALAKKASQSTSSEAALEDETSTSGESQLISEESAGSSSSTDSLED